MPRLLTLAAIAVAVPGSSALFAGGTAPFTKVTARAMPQAALTRRLFGDLGQIMLPAFFRGHSGHRPTQAIARRSRSRRSSF
jgi:hypothetical protein